MVCSRRLGPLLIVLLLMISVSCDNEPTSQQATVQPNQRAEAGGIIGYSQVVWAEDSSSVKAVIHHEKEKLNEAELTVHRQKSGSFTLNFRVNATDVISLEQNRSAVKVRTPDGIMQLDLARGRREKASNATVQTVAPYQDEIEVMILAADDLLPDPEPGPDMAPYKLFEPEPELSPEEVRELEEKIRRQQEGENPWQPSVSWSRAQPACSISLVSGRFSVAPLTHCERWVQGWGHGMTKARAKFNARIDLQAKCTNAYCIGCSYFWGYACQCLPGTGLACYCVAYGERSIRCCRYYI